LKLHLGIGIEPHLRFGAQRDALLAVLGEPTRVVTLDPHGHEREQLEFHELQMSLRFYDDRLAWIETESPTVEWQGHRLIGMRVDAALRLAEEAGLGAPEVTDHTSFTVLFWAPVWLELHVSYARVSRIHIGVLIDRETDNYLWPTPGDSWKMPN
jgi:hypothetical protein